MKIDRYLNKISLVAIAQNNIIYIHNIYIYYIYIDQRIQYLSATLTARL